jgi:hypothetical protein
MLVGRSSAVLDAVSGGTETADADANGTVQVTAIRTAMSFERVAVFKKRPRTHTTDVASLDVSRRLPV